MKQSKEFLKYKGKIQQIKDNMTEEQKKKRNEKAREKLIYRELAKKELEKILKQSFTIIEERINNKDMTTQDILKVLEHLRDSSGQKPNNKEEEQQQQIKYVFVDKEEKARVNKIIDDFIKQE